MGRGGGRVIMEKRRETYGVPATQRLDVEEGEEVRRFEELEGGDFSCGIPCTVSKRTGVESRESVPLIILQKMHAAADMVGVCIPVL